MKVTKKHRRYCGTPEDHRGLKQAGDTGRDGERTAVKHSHCEEGGCVNVEQVIDKSLIKKVLNKAGCLTRWTDFNFAANMREAANLA